MHLGNILFVLASFVTTFSFSADINPPELLSISVDSAYVDVTEDSQTITFTIVGSDESGINWGAGANLTSLVMRDQGGDFHHALGSDAEPGKLSISVTSDDKTGIWEISFLALTDNQGNRRLLDLN